MEFKASVFRLVLRTTWVRLRPVLALTGIYFAFLVPSINYVIAFRKLNLCNYYFDFRSNKIAIIQLRVRFGYFVFYRNSQN